MDRISKQHPAVLNIRTEGKRLRLAMPVKVLFKNHSYITTLPWGTKAEVEEEDLLSPMGAPFSFAKLRSEAYELQQKADKARARAAKRRKARR